MRQSFLTALLAVSIGLSVSAAKTAPYTEPMTDSDAKTSTSEKWDEFKAPLSLYWGNKDVHYRRADLPSTAMNRDTTLTAWRGERIGLLAVAYAPKTTGRLDLKLKGAWPGSGASWTRYVLTDEYDRCGYHPDTLTAYTVPDMIELPGTPLAIEGRTTRPIWVTIEVPRDAKPGNYPMELTLAEEGNRQPAATLKLDLKVSSRTLPAPKDQAFHLNLWQQPYSVSRYYGVEQWSPEHFELLKPYIQALARAGQSTISAILFYEPWGEQSNDKFSPMVETYRNPDGTWSYDYTIFDKWVEFCGENGLDGEIECFTMIPWEMNFRYYDKAKGEYQFLKTTTDSPEYADLWSNFIKGLYNHAREKGWADRTVISMDERALPDMMNAYRIATEADKDVKLALAGNYHPELIDKMYTYCITAGDPYPAEALKARRDKGLVTTYYTCCSSPKPNYFSNNMPSDAAYLPVYCTATGADGYLHWSFINWTDDPMTDTRFRMFAPGDTYFYYPDGRSSVRYERMVEGIQLSEKLNQLREEALKNNDVRTLDFIDKALLPIQTGLTSRNVTTGDIVRNLQQSIREF